MVPTIRIGSHCQHSGCSHPPNQAPGLSFVLLGWGSADAFLLGRLTPVSSARGPTGSWTRGLPGSCLLLVSATDAPAEAPRPSWWQQQLVPAVSFCHCSSELCPSSVRQGPPPALALHIAPLALQAVPAASRILHFGVPHLSLFPSQPSLTHMTDSLR